MSNYLVTGGSSGIAKSVDEKLAKEDNIIKAKE